MPTSAIAGKIGPAGFELLPSSFTVKTNGLAAGEIATLAAGIASCRIRAAKSKNEGRDGTRRSSWNGE